MTTPAMPTLRHLSIAIKALQELGLHKVSLYLLYRLGLKSGYWRLRTPVGKTWSISVTADLARSPDDFPLSLPSAQALTDVAVDAVASILSEAEEVVQGKVRLFGGEPLPLTWSHPRPLQHWTLTRDDDPSAGDIKWIWEPARLGWAFTLGRAYRLSGDERYPLAFWENLQAFLEHNPVNLGPNWASAQEVAMRILALSFARQVFGKSVHTTPERLSRLLAALAAHAARIPPTLIYARAQNNNHLLSEAVGLYTAGVLLTGWKPARRWRQLGWRWLNAALQKQIAADGTYIQHSTNYHRLMLHLALWAHVIARKEGVSLPPASLQRLQVATRWLLAQLDPISGRVPNLGHNDGANILPLAASGHTDFRPVAQAAARAFLGKACLPPGPWDELSLWLGLETASPPAQPVWHTSPAVHRLGNADTWATLRAVQFHDRPAHADQLHVDLWWRGHNIALDAGSYRYTAAPPWGNALAHTAVHNTFQVDGDDQMLRAGRFLWLDWAQARCLKTDETQQELIAEHDGYRRLGVIHRRTLKKSGPATWQVLDELLPSRHHLRPHIAVLHWLLPDWPWQLADTTLILQAPQGVIRISVGLRRLINQPPASILNIQLIRAGEVLVGPVEPTATLGWFSPTYGCKVPALSLRVVVQGALPFSIHSDWTLPG